MDRREFLKQSGFVVLSTLGIGFLPEVAAAKSSDFWTKNRTIDILRSQTKERASITYFINGRYDDTGYRHLCYMMRDVVDNGATVAMDVGLLNLIFAQQEWLRLVGMPNPYYRQTSGYRTPRHNGSIEGAAKNSEHILGRASDGGFNNTPPQTQVAMSQYYGVGGVGLYNSFVHNDVGRHRFWRGAY